MDDFDLWIRPDGSVEFLQHGGFDLRTLGPAELKRLSRIAEAAPGRWRVVDEAEGRVLGEFPTREAALEFERRHYREVMRRRMARAEAS